jgi:SOS-response transcriptional repressor LexA
MMHNEIVNEVTPLEIGAAIRRLRERRGMPISDLADAIGMNQGNLSRIENDQQDCKRVVAAKIAAVLGVRISDLYLEAEHAGNTSVPIGLKGTVPLISEVQAGHWREVLDDLQPGEGERIPTTYRVRTHTYALRVRGDSMEPKFPAGCIIIVEPEEQAEPGKYVVVRQNADQDATFKQLVADGGRHYLKPLNSRYPIMELARDAVFCGVVKKMEMDV